MNVKNKKLAAALGEHIRSLRLQKELSQEQLAYEADIPISQIGRIERGEINATVSTLFVIAEALKTDLKTVVDFKIKK
ncbi:MAG: helix-turn-helix transcriptional regulator [Bacteroidetes bacterium]|nr:helix-turn-helix transcriptional regulator [Bacteroidota bacterium]